MTTYKTARVDPTKPMELDDGTPVTLVRGPHGPDRQCVEVSLPEGASHRRDKQGWGGSWSYDLRTGIWCSGSADRYFVLRNRAPANPYTLFSGKKLQTRSGTPAEFVTVHNGKAIFKLSYPHSAAGFVERNLDGTVSGLRNYVGIARSDADDIVVVPERVTTYRNVYADGTVGETAHKTMTAVKVAIKTGKVRVGYLMQVHEGTELVKAEVITTVPARRGGGKAFPKA